MKIRHIYILATFLLLGGVQVQAIHQAKLPPVLNLNSTDAKTFLSDFRQAYISEDYTLNFTLTHTNKNTKEKFEKKGTLQGTRESLRNIIRVASGNSTDCIIYTGENSSAWIKNKDGKIESISQKDNLLPILQDTLLSTFDLQMPFIWWDTYEYVESKRFKGRATHIYTMKPDETLKYNETDVKGVRMYVDASFKALMQADLLDAKGEIIRSIHVLNFKKVDNQWILKTIDIIDKPNKAKSRIEITHAKFAPHKNQDIFNLQTLTPTPALK